MMGSCRWYRLGGFREDLFICDSLSAFYGFYHGAPMGIQLLYYDDEFVKPVK